MAGKKSIPPELKARMVAARAQMKAGETAAAAAAFTAIGAEAEAGKLRRPAIRAHMAAAAAFMRSKDTDSAKASVEKAATLAKGAKNPQKAAKAIAATVARLRTKGHEAMADHVQKTAEAALGMSLPTPDANDED